MEPSSYAKIDNHARMDTVLWFCPISYETDNGIKAARYKK